MAGAGGGPSRRSHTKSRKGCKTCKRRHIRCDETFPQCRNCTKHQVRCDYMDSPTAPGDESPRYPPQANLLWTPEIERTIDSWRATGEFPFPELNVFPQPHWPSVSKTDLRLIYHVCSISSELQRNRTSKLTIWTDYIPRFLSCAASQPFVLHALLSFAAAHLAWVTQSPETRNLAFQHNMIAMKGLHEATPLFSKANSDSILAASLLLSWQSTEWRNWLSLVTGIRTFVASMYQWREESLFADFIADFHFTPFPTLASISTYQVTPEARDQRMRILQHVQQALQRLQPYLSENEAEKKWVEQFQGYIDQLRASNPAQSVEEQFSQLYALRKWMFWVPITLLSARKGDVFMLLVLAHFYAVALAVEPNFPDIGAAFTANLAVSPLEEIIRIIDAVSATPTFSQNTQTASAMMDFPRDTLSTFRTRVDWSRRQSQEIAAIQSDPYGLDTLSLDLGNQIAEFGYSQSLSPAFAPSPLHLSSPTMISDLSSMPPMTPRSPWLEVPPSGIEPHLFTPASSSVYASPTTSSAISSPASSMPSTAAATPYSLPSAHDDGLFNFGSPPTTFGGYPHPTGFVAPPPTVWT
ncbi:hypothetical protein P152DRAFT_398471 [Eremomyces bilateralis CBS 781.70]|uniref:Zn(2)-C6 fungal-type domain-containing protein n=1 Tax=Eremomyces bilateralis CBS 781.70 TaxID=1392243 RepID=A0A6G1G1M9_9PEZI|nr:uncharacterized protein P152DRAFT_398471 [Eremomyces bilateralis CBS 781.70]KAF1811830.1 hypothetical protein P152DRAFT_398471 [Eremomyces bilateralis CBS 781.70]